MLFAQSRPAGVLLRVADAGRGVGREGLPAAEESTDTRPGPEELAIFGEQYADTLRRMQTELSALERLVLMAGLKATPAQTARGVFHQKRGQCAGPCAPQAARCAHNLGFRRFACVIYQPAPSSA